MSIDNAATYSIRAITVLTHGHGASGVERSYVMHTDLRVHIGRIVSVPSGSSYTNAVIVSINETAHAMSADAPTAILSPYSLTHVQLSLLRWIANHYVTTMEHALSICISRAMFPLPTQIWSATENGIAAELGLVAEDERGILYQLRRQGAHSTAELLSSLTVTPPKLQKLLNRLLQRGYVALSLRFATIPTRKPIVPFSVVLNQAQLHTHAEWVNRSKKRKAVIEICSQHGNSPIAVHTVGGYSALKEFVQRGILVAVPNSTPAQKAAPTVILTEDQLTVVQTIEPQIGGQVYAPYLLHGVTGSGKTEIYFTLIERCITLGLQTLMLIPEVALTTQIASRFEQRFPGRVVVIHGDIHLADRHSGWQMAERGEAAIILGPRSALSVPIPHLGLVIVDEEHDASYKSDKSPQIHARDTAMVYAHFAHVPVVLGSATPSVEMMYACQNGSVTYLRLPDRVGANGQSHERPPIRIVDMRGSTCIDTHGLISHILYERIQSTIADNGQVMLLLNRRGSSGSRICRNCGTVAMCPRCSSPLIGHGSSRGTQAMCHTCGYHRIQDTHCPSCFHSEFLDIGSGTQRVVQVLQSLFTTTPILQWDRDTSDTAKAHAAMLTEIKRHQAAIIVGTQMIAKGLDLERVKLVGVVNADLALHLPDFRSTERTFQLLTQVAGRAGRRAGEASVIFQSYTPDNYAIQCAARYDDDGFYTNELTYRAYMQYPPYQRMAKLTWVQTNDAVCAAQAIRESKAIVEAIDASFPDARTIGPTPAFFHKVRNRYHWQLLIVGTQIRTVLAGIAPLHHAIIDVDPASTL